MKKFKLLLFSIIAAVAFASCGGSGSSASQSPSDVVDSYLTGMESGDYQKAAKCIVIPDDATVEMMAEQLKIVFEPMTITYVAHEILGEEIGEESNSATVTATVDMGEKKGVKRVSRKTTFDLMKIDGEWKLDM